MNTWRGAQGRGDTEDEAAKRFAFLGTRVLREARARALSRENSSLMGFAPYGYAGREQ